MKMPRSNSNKTGEREREGKGKMSSTADVFAHIQTREKKAMKIDLKKSYSNVLISSMLTY
jgi:hypothetical protein